MPRRRGPSIHNQPQCTLFIHMKISMLQENISGICLIFQNLKSNNDKFLPGWKSVIADSTNTKLYSSLYRIVDSSNSELIPQIDVSEDKESEISEDIYPMR